MIKISVKLALLTFYGISSNATAQLANEDIFELSLNELLNEEVTTASNRKELLSKAPATVIVLDKKAIRNRGYENLSEALSDLPGMEMVYTYGDTYYLNYMRGYRYTIGTPYLVMIDGVTINSLYFNKTTQLSAFPISSVERIEVVYGPASSVYGANAFMGVVNVITQTTQSDESSFTAINKVDSDGNYVLDYAAHLKLNTVSARFALHYEDAELNDRVNNESNYWLSDKHYNSALWGQLQSNAGLVPTHFSSPIKHVGFDGEIRYNDFKLSAFYLKENNGYGLVYPIDKLPAPGNWPLYQYNIEASYQHVFSERLASKTRISYTSDGVEGSAYDLEAWNVTNTSDELTTIGGIGLAPNESARMVHFQHWLSKNKAWSFSQDFEYKHSENLALNSGIKYSRKDLQKAYDQTYSGPISPLANTYQLPEQPSNSYGNTENRVIWQDYGVYLQSSYQVNPHHNVNIGVRYDHNNEYGSNTSLRSAYIYNRDKWNIKLMYGEAYHVPTPRSLYGAWSGSGADANLSPESSDTIELSTRYSQATASHLISLYAIDNSDTIVNVAGGAKNIGARQILGLDYHLTSSFETKWSGPLQLSLYATHYFHIREDVYDSVAETKIGEQDIGDIAKNKLWLIADWQPIENTNINLTGRFVDKRNTVNSNPLGNIPGYGVVDLTINYQLPSISGLSLSVKVYNLFDKTYYHPGSRDADAGDPLIQTDLLDSIGFDETNPKAWNGSLGWYNSRLPQPERRIQFGVNYQF